LLGENRLSLWHLDQIRRAVEQEKINEQKQAQNNVAALAGSHRY
jgi:hypothetical protein